MLLTCSAAADEGQAAVAVETVTAINSLDVRRVSLVFDAMLMTMTTTRATTIKAEAKLQRIF